MSYRITQNPNATVSRKKRERRDYIRPAKKHTLFTAQENIIYADFETFNDKFDMDNGTHRIYACAYCLDDGPVILFEGESALDDFMYSILDLDRRKTYTMVFYNGSRFDLFFVFKWLEKNNIPNKILYHNGAYKKITFNRNIQTFDLCLFTNTSLKRACKDFGCDIQKGDFDHNRVNSFKDAENTRLDWMPYLRLDILSMRQVF